VHEFASATRLGETLDGVVRKVPPTGQESAGYLDPARVARYQDGFADRGLVRHKVNVHQALDQRFVDYANVVSGAYRPARQPRRPG
jgi:hypothetical protein